MQMALIMDYPDILAWMKGLIGPGKRFPRIAAMARFLGLDEVHEKKLYKALREKSPSVPQSDTLLQWIYGLGAYDEADVKFMLERTSRHR